MTTKKLTLGLEVKADGTVGVVRQFDQMQDAVHGVGQEAGAAQEPIAALGAKLLAMGAGTLAVDQLVSALASVGQTGDVWRSLGARVEAANAHITDGAERMKEVAEAARATNRGLDATATLYTSLERASDLNNRSQADARRISAENLEITRALGNALRIAGTGAAAAEGALTQLGQALESGVLRGDELNSVLEQMPMLGTAIAQSMGIQRAELRAYAEQGKITAAVVRTAVLAMASEWEATAARMPQTLDQALTNLETRWTQYVGQSQAVATASQALVGFLDGIGGSLDTIGRLAGEGALLLLSAGLLAGAKAVATYVAAQVERGRADAAAAASAKVMGAAQAEQTQSAVQLAQATRDAAQAELQQAQAGRLAAAEAAKATAASLATAQARAEAAGRLGQVSRAELEAAAAAKAAAAEELDAAQRRVAVTAKAVDAAEREVELARERGGMDGAERRRVDAYERDAIARNQVTAATERLAAAETQGAEARTRYLAAARSDRVAAMAGAERELTAAQEAHLASTKALTAANATYDASLTKVRASAAGLTAATSASAAALSKVGEMAVGLGRTLASVGWLLVLDQVLKIAMTIGEIIDQYREMGRIQEETAKTTAAVNSAAAENLRKFAAAADTAIQTEDQLRQISREGAKAYLERLQQAARYWAAVAVQAKQAGDLGASKEASDKANAYGKALREQPDLIQKLIAAQTALSPVAAGMLQEFDELAGKGKDAAGAIGQLVGALRFDTAADAMVNTSAVLELLGRLGSASAKTGERIRATGRDVSEGLGPALDKLSGESLKNFASAWERAMGAADTSAVATTAGVMESILGAAIRKLGLDLTELRAGTSASGREMAAAFEAAAIAAQGSAPIIAAAWDALLGKLRTTGDIDLAREQLLRLGREGKISLDQVTYATKQLDLAQQRLAATTGPIADAFARLGVTSSRELKALAAQAAADFETIRQSGTATPGDIAAAWEAYAKKAIASGDASAKNLAAQEGAVLGLIDKYRELAGETQAVADATRDAAAAAASQAAAANQAAAATARQQDAAEPKGGDWVGRRATEVVTVGDPTPRPGVATGKGPGGVVAKSAVVTDLENQIAGVRAALLQQPLQIPARVIDADDIAWAATVAGRVGA